MVSSWLPCIFSIKLTVNVSIARLCLVCSIVFGSLFLNKLRLFLCGTFMILLMYGGFWCGITKVSMSRLCFQILGGVCYLILLAPLERILINFILYLQNGNLLNRWRHPTKSIALKSLSRNHLEITENSHKTFQHTFCLDVGTDIYRINTDQSKAEVSRRLISWTTGCRVEG